MSMLTCWSALLTGTFLAAAAGSAIAPVDTVRGPACGPGAIVGAAPLCQDIALCQNITQNITEGRVDMILDKFREALRAAPSDLARTPPMRSFNRDVAGGHAPAAATLQNYASSGDRTRIVLLGKEDALAT
ncbi:hypothetical protein ACQR1W_26350 [Bradyrhizobium sp. HKCCYLS1011]|uniref:hypothetical protein n=1 Tax=Bradyrhizobium sp. HKCCYLS1011 TaxID=3420733 RepID=UPI003EBEB0E8